MGQKLNFKKCFRYTGFPFDVFSLGNNYNFTTQMLAAQPQQNPLALAFMNKKDALIGLYKATDPKNYLIKELHFNPSTYLY